MYSLDTLNLLHIIANEEPLLRDSAEKIDCAPTGGDGTDRVKKQLAGAIRDSMSGLSRNSIRSSPQLYCHTLLMQMIMLRT